jgi:hypothetical protein
MVGCQFSGQWCSATCTCVHGWPYNSGHNFKTLVDAPNDKTSLMDPCEVLIHGSMCKEDS